MSRMNMLSSAPSTPAVHSHSSLFLLPYAMCATSNVFNTTIHRNLNQVNPTIALSHLLNHFYFDAFFAGQTGRQSS
jgi:hypothetical protein